MSEIAIELSVQMFIKGRYLSARVVTFRVWILCRPYFHSFQGHGDVIIGVKYEDLGKDFLDPRTNFSLIFIEVFIDIVFHLDV